jgi:hypothetical protein
MTKPPMVASPLREPSARIARCACAAELRLPQWAGALS